MGRSEPVGSWKRNHEAFPGALAPVGRVRLKRRTNGVSADATSWKMEVESRLPDRRHGDGSIRLESDFRILFHPDCNRRLRHFTGSADLLPGGRSARGLPGLSRDTAGGEFHPALRISRSSDKPGKAPLSRLLYCLLVFRLPTLAWRTGPCC